MAKKSKSASETIDETITSTVDGLQDQIQNMLFGCSSPMPTESASCGVSSCASSAGYTPSGMFKSLYPTAHEYGDVTMHSLNIDGLNVGMMLRAIYDTVAAKNPINIESNLDVIQHYSAEQLAKFIAYEAKKIISGSGDAVSELTEWLKAKPE